MGELSEIWTVYLLVDGVPRACDVRIDPPFFIRRGSAEAKAIKEAHAQGGRDVRATDCFFHSYVESKS